MRKSFFYGLLKIRLACKNIDALEGKLNLKLGYYQNGLKQIR